MNTTDKPMKEQKHLLINDRFCELENEISRLENLVAKVGGEDSKKDTEEVTKPMSLTAFLNDTPERLSQLTALLTEQRKKLTEYLF